MSPPSQFESHAHTPKSMAHLLASSSLSPLSVQSSSAEDSFHTAADESDALQSTNASSPLVSPPHRPRHRHREARPLPRNLQEHCRILLEEDLYPSAIGLLNSILVSGTSRPSAKAVPVPPVDYLALLNTLVVHPVYTTRASEPDHVEISSLALSYLRSVLASVGPLHADFRTAFQFTSLSRGGRRNAYPSNEDDSDVSDESSSADRLTNKLANAGALWAQGQDFWSVVGWVFNCSASHPKRWRHWKAWLEFMMDVLEQDWDEREARDQSAQSEDSAGESYLFRRESLICTYLNQHLGTSNGFKVILKTILADGDDFSRKAFPEVFQKELRKPKDQSKKRKRHEALDLENGKFGDYFDDDSSGASEPPTPEKTRTSAKKPTFGETSPGVVESIHLRLRLFGMVSLATFHLNTGALEQLYENFVFGLKVLPIETFALFVSARQGPLRMDQKVTMVKGLFRLLLPSSYRDPRRVDPGAYKLGALTMQILEICYVGHPANTVGLEENAKLSLVMESAMQMLWQGDILTHTQSFADAVEKGITARLAKTNKKRTSKGRMDADEEVAAEILMESTDRIRLILEILEAAAELEEDAAAESAELGETSMASTGSAEDVICVSA